MQRRAFTTQFLGRANVLKTKIGIGLPKNFTSTDPAKDSDFHEYTAIWDTGASHSVITPKVVADLGLKPISATTVHHAGGQSRVNVYLVNIVLPGKVLIPGVRVSEAPLNDGQEVSEVERLNVLIGMDIINNGDFAVTNQNGSTMMSFRIPSMESIDFIPSTQQKNWEGTPQNNKCPCGSGSKYKNCHGNK